MLFLSVLVADQPIVIFTKSEQALNSKVNVFRSEVLTRNLLATAFLVVGRANLVHESWLTFGDDDITLASFGEVHHMTNCRIMHSKLMIYK